MYISIDNCSQIKNRSKFLLIRSSIVVQVFDYLKKISAFTYILTEVNELSINIQVLSEGICSGGKYYNALTVE